MFSPNYYEQIGVKMFEEANRMTHEEFNTKGDEEPKKKSSLWKQIITWLARQFDHDVHKPPRPEPDMKLGSPSPGH